MFVDARTLPRDTNLHADVCIIGAGAAGITLARELAGTRLTVCLLESGGLEYDAETQALYKGESVGLPYDPLDAARLRFFGGTTNHWAGWCRPLDEIDFEPRDWVAHSGWPFRRSHLLKYYQRAQALCQVGSADFDPKTWASNDAAPLPFTAGNVTTMMWRYSPPTRFGQVYREDIEKSKNVTAYLWANVVGIETPESAAKVTRIAAACLPGNRFTVTAKVYVLAAGGIENARLLLCANQVAKNGLGNDHDLVGRFFADHAGFQLGAFLLSDPKLSLAFYRRHTHRAGRDTAPSSLAGGLTLSEATLRREKLANIGTFVFGTGWADVFSPRPAVAALIKKRDFGGFWKYVGDVAVNIDDMAVAAYRNMFTSGPEPELFNMVAVIEPTPNPHSRVTLSGERDRFGNSRVRLDWQLTADDRRTLQRAREIFAAEFGQAAIGRVLVAAEEERWPPAWFDYGRHHMGTTRMHTDPKQGVVDAHCKVHGIANLFVAGSSVFPSFGFSQPTLTIVALALRLAERIKGVLR